MSAVERPTDGPDSGTTSLTVARPWRDVVGGWNGADRPGVMTGRGGILGPDTSRRARWWRLRLECGHQIERPVRYLPADQPMHGGTQQRDHSDIAPPPRRVRCDLCANEPPESR